ncbi:hypothetical protein MIND_01417300 [Mycena indigotica]|uniref:Uncharacterized protein n=1 Tax=Mycena indigotica TaxID=2126181 RepID=A0A8H6RYP3_9AGAR|nr:uncharacterized protein MIND_01417300 [Mycena indigotica]KAF7289005.1 hypothetical protein MIND_01417300 [Mycena indigotica]
MPCFQAAEMIYIRRLESLVYPPPMRAREPAVHFSPMLPLPSAAALTDPLLTKQYLYPRSSTHRANLNAIRSLSTLPPAVSTLRANQSGSGARERSRIVLDDVQKKSQMSRRDSWHGLEKRLPRFKYSSRGQLSRSKTKSKRKGKASHSSSSRSPWLGPLMDIDDDVRYLGSSDYDSADDSDFMSDEQHRPLGSAGVTPVIALPPSSIRVYGLSPSPSLYSREYHSPLPRPGPTYTTRLRAPMAARPQGVALSTVPRIPPQAPYPSYTSFAGVYAAGATPVSSPWERGRTVERQTPIRAYSHHDSHLQYSPYALPHPVQTAPLSPNVTYYSHAPLPGFLPLGRPYLLRSSTWY